MSSLLLDAKVLEFVAVSLHDLLLFIQVWIQDVLIQDAGLDFLALSLLFLSEVISEALQVFANSFRERAKNVFLAVLGSSKVHLILLHLLELLQERLDRLDQVFVDMELVVVHQVGHVQVSWLRASLEELFGVAVRDQSVLLAMQDEHWAFRILYHVDVSKLFVHDEAEEAGPTQDGFGCVLDASIRRHQEKCIWVPNVCEIRAGP